MSSSRYWHGRPTLPSFDTVLSRSRNVSPETVSVRPYASANHADGNVRWMRSMSGIGIFSPPAMITRTDDRSRSSMPGTPGSRAPWPARATRCVTRDRSISSTTAAASNARWMIVVAPTAISVVVVRSSAPTWYSGPHARPTSARGEAELGDVRVVLPRQVGVGDHDALRPTRRARRVHQAVHVVGRRRARAPGRSRPTGGRRARPPVRRRSRDAHPDEVVVEPVVASSASSSERLVAHERPRLGVVEDVAHLRGRQPPVDRHRDRAEVVGGEDRREELGAVVREQTRRRRPRPTPRSCSPARERGGVSRTSPGTSPSRRRRPRAACPATGGHGARGPRPS